MNIELNIDKYFPLPTYRTGQKEAITKIFEQFEKGEKCVLLEAPTGSGKSAIGYTLAQMYKSAYYLSPQKILQDQLTDDFGEQGSKIGQLEPMIDIKGRNAYKCDYYIKAINKQIDVNLNNLKVNIKDPNFDPENITCDMGECKQQGLGKLQECEGFCKYNTQLNKAINSDICLMNFSAFLYQQMTNRFKPRELIIIDEGHSIEDALMGFIELMVSDRQFRQQRIKFPIYETVEEYKKYFEEIELEGLISEQLMMAKLKGDIKEQDEWEKISMKYAIFMGSESNEWVVEHKQARDKSFNNIILRPIFVDKFFKNYISENAKHILIMSATILSKNTMCDSLGLPENTKMFRLNSTFPPENRPIKIIPCGSLNYKNKLTSYPKLLQTVNEICEKYPNSKGIIHTHTYEICDLIINGCKPKIKSRLLYQKDMEFNNDKNMLINKHKLSDNSIIIAPAMHEGLDLKYDLARFQIICKVPYPSLGDKQIAARMQISDEYYQWRCITKLIQSYGRAIRADDDTADTYILDEDFNRLVSRSKAMFPKWFLEAIIQ